MSEAAETSGSWQDRVYETTINIWPEADKACDGFGDYYATVFWAVQADHFARLTLHIGNYLPKNSEGDTDYEGIVDIADFYLTNYYGNGKLKYFANGISVRKDCYDYDHDDGITTDQQSRTELARREHVASIVVASEISPFETVEESDSLHMLGRIGIWLPRAKRLEVFSNMSVIKSLRGGDTSAAFIATHDDEKIVQRRIFLPDDMFDPEAIETVLQTATEQEHE